MVDKSITFRFTAIIKKYSIYNTPKNVQHIKYVKQIKNHIQYAKLSERSINQKNLKQFKFVRVHYIAFNSGLSGNIPFHAIYYLRNHRHTL